MTERLTIATDGSCRGTPGPGGWSWAVSAEQWRAGGKAETTNNVMELYAVGFALSDTSPAQPLLIEIDSMYVLNACTGWLIKWKANGWRRADKQPVANVPIIARIDQLLQGRDVQWRHVRGHSGHELNEIVDTHAKAASAAIRDGLVVDTGPGMTG